MSAYRGPEPPDPAKERAELRAFEKQVGRGFTVPRDAGAFAVATVFAGVTAAFAVVDVTFAAMFGVLACVIAALGVLGIIIDRRSRGGGRLLRRQDEELAARGTLEALGQVRVEPVGVAAREPLDAVDGEPAAARELAEQDRVGA